MRRLWLVLAICVVGAYFSWRERPIPHPPGVLAPDDPVQRLLSADAPVFHQDRYQIQALAEFALEARVLARENYRFDAGAGLAPMDLALGWGPMSDSAVLDQIDIHQGNRFYYWSTANFPIPRHEIEIHSANMHLIPASLSVAKQLRAVRPGHILRLHGYLVEARRDDGWHWRSSLSREDTGDGACELVWVENVTFY